MTDPESEAQQAAAALRVELAPRLGAYFHALLAEGFERAEALKLVRDFQCEIFAQDE